MKITDFLSKDAITLNLQAKTKREAIEELLTLLEKNVKEIKENKKEVLKSIMDRERMGSTGIGQHIAIPHARDKNIKKIVCALGISKSPQGVDFDSLDGEPVHIIFLLLVPQNEINLLLRALSKIARMLRDKFVRQELKEASSVEEVMSIISKEDI